MMKTAAGILAALLLFTGTELASQAPGPVTIDTTELGKEILGHHSATPVEIVVEDGRIVSVTALPSEETPAYYRRAVKVLNLFVGMSVEEALDAEVDAVSGATMSSNALIRNVREGLSTLTEETEL